MIAESGEAAVDMGGIGGSEEADTVMTASPLPLTIPTINDYNNIHNDGSDESIIPETPAAADDDEDISIAEDMDMDIDCTDIDLDSDWSSVLSEDDYVDHAQSFGGLVFIFGSRKKAHARIRKKITGTKWECEDCAHESSILDNPCTACGMMNLDLLELGESENVAHLRKVAEEERRRDEERRKKEAEEKAKKERAAQTARRQQIIQKREGLKGLQTNLEEMKKLLKQKVAQRDSKGGDSVASPVPASPLSKASTPQPVTPLTVEPSSPLQKEVEGPELPPHLLAARKMRESPAKTTFTFSVKDEAVAPPVLTPSEDKSRDRRRRSDSEGRKRRGERDERDRDKDRRRRETDRGDDKRKRERDRRTSLTSDSKSVTPPVEADKTKTKLRLGGITSPAERARAPLDKEKRTRSESPQQTQTVKRGRGSSKYQPAVPARLTEDEEKFRGVTVVMPSGKKIFQPSRNSVGGSESLLKREGEQRRKEEAVNASLKTSVNTKTNAEMWSEKLKDGNIAGAEELKPDPTTVLTQNHGVVSYIATHAWKRAWMNPYKQGLINATASTTTKGEVSQVLNNKFAPDCTFATAGDRAEAGVPSYVAFDFTEWEVLPYQYTLAHAWEYPHNYIRSWSLRGSEDNYKWDTLCKHVSDNSISEQNKVATFKLDPQENVKFYRYFMIRLEPKGNSRASSQLVSNCFELYGFCRKITRNTLDNNKPCNTNSS